MHSAFERRADLINRSPENKRAAQPEVSDKIPFDIHVLDCFSSFQANRTRDIERAQHAETAEVAAEPGCEPGTASGIDFLLWRAVTEFHSFD